MKTHTLEASQFIFFFRLFCNCLNCDSCILVRVLSVVCLNFCRSHQHKWPGSRSYNADFIRRNTYKPAEHNGTNANPTPVTTATIPISRALLRPSRGYYNLTISVLLTNPLRLSLRQLLTNVKDKDEPNDRQGAVYKIKCCDCQATYIGEIGRN